MSTRPGSGRVSAVNVFQRYKPFRNKVASLSYDDALYVIWAYSQYLQINNFKMPRDIDVHNDFLTLRPRQQWIAEWELEILAKEVILNGSAISSKNKSLRSWRTLSRLVNQLKNLENEIYGIYGGTNNVLIEMLRIAHRQFVWQSNRPNSISMTRYFKLFNQQEINRLCLNKFGLSIKDIYLCGTAFMGAYFSRPATDTHLKLPSIGISEEKANAFLSFTCRTLSVLKTLLKSEQQYNDKFAYAYNSLRAYPLIKMPFQGRDAVVCPLPTLLFWRITGGLYYELVEEKGFSQAFGDSFQEYVGQVVEKACPKEEIRLLAEEEYGSKKARKRSVDWIVCEDGSAIFLECKAKRLTWSAKTSLDDEGPLKTDIDNLADAVVQLYRTITHYTKGQYSHFRFSANRKIYPVVVTLENWHLIGPKMAELLQEAVVTKLIEDNISESVLRDMPYSICPVEELEPGMQVINDVGIHDFLDGLYKETENQQAGWHAYMNTRFPKYQVKKLFADEYDDLFLEVVDRNKA